MIKVTKINQDGSTVSMIVTVRNLIEITRKDDESSWMKYWDGSAPDYGQPPKPRTAVIKESVEEVYDDYY